MEPLQQPMRRKVLCSLFPDKAGEILRLAWGRSVLYHRVGLKLESGALDVPVFCTGPLAPVCSLPRCAQMADASAMEGTSHRGGVKGTG